MSGTEFKRGLNDRHRASEVVDRLSAEFQLRLPPRGNPFMVLVRMVLSQNTNWRNTRVAFDNLISRFGTPSQLAGADMHTIEGLIRSAGLYKAKAKNLRELARVVQEKYGGDLGQVLREPPEEARRELLTLPGVGYKTADCVLLFAAGREVLPVDTHVARIAKRLGFAGPRDDREEIKRKLEGLIPQGKRGEAHLLLIQLGRRFCRALNPLCDECPVNLLCPKVGVS
ncbi:MAG: endonuclease III [Candidatus Hadarchaeota archaeon]|nr:endonuclease III [Candidatus Hadarchaeota archaeon]